MEWHLVWFFFTTARYMQYCFDIGVFCFFCLSFFGVADLDPLGERGGAGFGGVVLPLAEEVVECLWNLKETCASNKRRRGGKNAATKVKSE